MIRSLKGRTATAIAAGEPARGFPPDLIRSAENKLAMIEAAEILGDLRSPPGNRLHRLKGNRKGQHAIRINDQWRVCFTWKDNAADNVEIVDYHD